MAESINVKRRCALGAAAALGWALSAPSWAAGTQPWSPPPVGEGQIGASSAQAGVVTVLARGRKDGMGAGLWIRNDGARPLRAVQSVVRGMWLGKAEAFFVRFQWSGELAPKAWAFVGATSFDLLGAAAPEPVAALSVEVLHARADGSQAGPEAPWSVSASALAALAAEMESGVDADAARARAYAKGKGGGVPMVAGFAKMWAKPGRNPYDPRELNVAFAWRGAAAGPVELKSLKATFFQSPSLAAFLRVEAQGAWTALPGARGLALVSFGFPQASADARAAFEAKARGHGVDVERGYVDPVHPEGARAPSKG